MKIWSKTLRNIDLVTCYEQVNADYPGCKLTVEPTWHLHTGPRTRYFESVHLRTFRNTHTTYASWTEWGWWLARLFEIDPDARANSYKGRADFHAQTGGRFLHMPTPRERQIRMAEAHAYAERVVEDPSGDARAARLAAWRKTELLRKQQAGTHSTKKHRII